MKYLFLSFVILSGSCGSNFDTDKPAPVVSTTSDSIVGLHNSLTDYDKKELLYRGIIPWVHSDEHFKFKVISDSTSNSGKTYLNSTFINRVEVYARIDGELMQTLIPDEENDYEHFHDSSNVVGFDDVNFDGFTDVRILSWTSINLQTEYEFWVYNPTKKKFLKNDELHALLNPCFDPVRKTIHSHWRSGFMGMGHALHHWNENKLELLAEEYEVMGIDPNQPGSYVKTEIIDGRKVETEREIREFTVDYSHECDSCKLHKK